MSHSPSRDGRRKVRQQPNHRRLFFAFLAFMLLSLGSFAVILVLIVVPYDRSNFTQAHGLLRGGIVTSVANHPGRSDSADVGVQLAGPVTGPTTTIAHVPALVSLSPGATVQVLVDPQDPGYAELPHQPYIRKSSAQAAVIFGLVLIALSTSVTVISARAWRKQHLALRSQGRTASSGPPAA